MSRRASPHCPQATAVARNYIPAPTSYSPPRDAWSEEKRYPCIFKVPFKLTGARAYAEKSLEYYNKKNGTNYELSCSLICENFSADRNRGSWVHCNFSAKQDVDDNLSRKIFFAEILLDRNYISMNETLTITACLLLEGIPTAGCNLCSNVLHPANGFLKGQNKPRRLNSPTSSSSPPHSPSSHFNFDISPGETTAGCSQCSDIIHPASLEIPKGNHESLRLNLTNSPTCSPSSPSSPSAPISPDFSGKENLVDMHSFKDEISAKLHRHLDITLGLFNKENGTGYNLVDVLDGNGIYCEGGYWFHCNFSANLPKGVIDGESSSKLFFAEYFVAIAETVTWTANACHLLDGKTTDGCAFCRGIIHPTHGFSQGGTRALFSRCKTLPRDLASTEKRCRRAEMAIEHYNDINRSDYELVRVFLSNGFISDGTWYHLNFEAKHDVDGKYTSNIFFAELFADNYHPTTETLTVTACQILDGETTGWCGFCSDVIHPSQGYLKSSLE